MTVGKIFGKMRDLMFGEYEEEEYYEDDYTAAPAPVREPVAFSLREADREMELVQPSRKASARGGSAAQYHGGTAAMSVVIIKPEEYEDAQEICDQIKSNRPVVVNLEKVEYPVAQRIMDFLSGTCYSLEGSIQRVANNIFIIAPGSVDISGNFKEELKTKGVLLPWMNSGNGR